MQNRFFRSAAILSVVFISSLGLVSGQSGPPPIPPVPENALTFYPLMYPPWVDCFDESARSWSNVTLVPSAWNFGGYCAGLDTNVPAYLQYDIYQDGGTNVVFDNGAISLWFQPNWTSVADGGAGPTNWAVLFSAGHWTSNASDSAWAIAISPSGSNLLMEAQSGGSNQVVFDVPVDFDAGDWHSLVVSYSITNCAVYLEGALVTNVSPIQYYPTSLDCSNYGMFFGSLSADGDDQCHGQLQWVATYYYTLDTNDVAADYNDISSYIAWWGGSLPGGGSFHPDDGGAPSPPGTNTNTWDGPLSPPPGPLPVNPGTNLYLIISLESNAYASILLSNTIAGLPYVLLSAPELTGPWVTNQSVLALTNTALAAPIPVSSSSNQYFRAVQETPGTLRWVTCLPGGGQDIFASNGIDGSPALASNGTIYLAPACNDTNSSNELYAIDSITGTIKWSINILSSNSPQQLKSSSPAIGTNGLIYIGSADDNVYAISDLGTNATIHWATNLGVTIFGSPAIGPDGAIFIGTGDSTDGNLSGFFSITNGERQWIFIPIDHIDPDGGNAGAIDGSAAVAANGSIYFQAEGHRFHALSPNGNIEWFFPILGRNEDDPSPAIAADGTIYAVQDYESPFVLALHPDGSLKWVFDESFYFFDDFSTYQSSPVVGEDGTVYVGTSDLFSANTVAWAINPEGSLKWMLTLPGTDDGAYTLSTPALAANGTVYIGSQDHNLYAITNSGTNAGVAWSYTTGGAIVSSPVIGPDGTVYVGSEDGYLYAVWGSSPLATNAPWPMFHQNPAHTGLQPGTESPLPDCGAPFVYDGAITTNDAGQQNGFIFAALATNYGVDWYVFASSNLVDWTNLGTVLLAPDGLGDGNGVGVFADSFTGPDRFYVLSSGTCLSSSCRSRAIGFVNLTYAEGTNLIADQLCDDHETNMDLLLPMNTVNDLYGNIGAAQQGTAAILTWNGSGFNTSASVVEEGTYAGWESGFLEDYHTTLLPGSSVLFSNGSGASFTFPFAGLIRPQQEFKVQAGTSNFLSAGIPVAGSVTNLTGYAAQNGDVVELWRTNLQSYQSFTYNGSAWSPSNPIVGIGEGFVLIPTNSSAWTNTWTPSFPCTP